jgi:UPF0755 protein
MNGGGRMIDDLDLAWEEQHRSHRGQRGGRPAPQQPNRGRNRRDKGRRKRSFGALFVSFIMLVALGAGVYWGVGKVQDYLTAPDYSTTGTATVTIEVKDGDTASEIGNTLFKAGVVKSAKAFVNVAAADPRSLSIQVGLYKMFKPMPAKDALALLLDPDKARVVNGVTIPEGMITLDIYKKFSKATGIPVKDFQTAAKDPTKLGVAKSWFVRNDKKKAAKSVEGFLYPATYEVPPNADATTILKMMVQKFNDVTGDLDFIDTVNKERGGISPYEALIAASIVEQEATNPVDFAKVVRVLYNRVYSRDFPCDCLQIDSAVNYWIKLQGKTGKDSDNLLHSELHNPDNPYNTHDVAGMPAGPIGNPGEAALKAAMKPTDGPWLFFMTVDKQGTMAYAVDYDGHQANVRKACDNGVLSGESCQ